MTIPTAMRGGRARTCSRCYHPIAGHLTAHRAESALQTAACSTAGCPCFISWES